MRSRSLMLLLLVAGIVMGCSGVAASSQTEGLKLAPLDGMPQSVKDAPAVVREAYQFAAANPEVLKQIPCYCGCGAMGHTSNEACYVSGRDAAGNLTFDEHALGCSVCVDITQDAMRLLRQGAAVPDIRAYIDRTYSKYGPSNMP